MDKTILYMNLATVVLNIGLLFITGHLARYIRDELRVQIEKLKD